MAVGKSYRAGHVVIALAVTLGLAHAARAQSTPKLVAPVYAGAATLGCVDNTDWARCTFGTKDTIDQVKAFYDKAVGHLHETKNGFIAPVRAGKQVEGEGTTSTVFATVRLESLPPATPPAAADTHAQMAVQRYKFLNVLASEVVWNGDAQYVDYMKKTGFHTRQDFDAAFKRYGHLESSFFPEDQAAAARAEYDAKSKAISAKFAQQGEEAGRRSSADVEKIQQENARRRQDLERQRQEDCKRGPTAQQKADREELKRILRKNSVERYNRFAVATDKMDKAGCNAPMAPGSPAFEAAMEIGQVLSEDPEAQAYAEKIQKRDEANRPRPASPAADSFAKNVAGQQQSMAQEHAERWQAAMEYLAAMNKIHARTRIVISGEKFGADAGGIVTDRAKVEELWAKRKEKAGDDSADSVAGPRSGGGGSADKPADAASAPGQQPSASKQPPAQEPAKKEQGFSTDDAVNAGKQGLNALKKLF